MIGLLLAATLYVLPDPVLTPGAVRPLTTDVICQTKWGLDKRFVTERMKRHVLRAYRAADVPGTLIDHVVPRQLGGRDDILNLYPQTIDQSRVKDRLENKLSALVCAKQLTLTAAQRAIAKDWVAAYRLYVGPLEE